eukprot:1161805-Pelagomonas_calceolata.AAC.2
MVAVNTKLERKAGAFSGPILLAREGKKEGVGKRLCKFVVQYAISSSTFGWKASDTWAGNCAGKDGTKRDC